MCKINEHSSSKETTSVLKHSFTTLEDFENCGLILLFPILSHESKDEYFKRLTSIINSSSSTVNEMNRVILRNEKELPRLDKETDKEYFDRLIEFNKNVQRKIQLSNNNSKNEYHFKKPLVDTHTQTYYNNQMFKLLLDDGTEKNESFRYIKLNTYEFEKSDKINIGLLSFGENVLFGTSVKNFMLNARTYKIVQSIRNKKQPIRRNAAYTILTESFNCKNGSDENNKLLNIYMKVNSLNNKETNIQIASVRYFVQIDGEVIMDFDRQIEFLNGCVLDTSDKYGLCDVINVIAKARINNNLTNSENYRVSHKYPPFYDEFLHLSEQKRQKIYDSLPVECGDGINPFCPIDTFFETIKNVRDEQPFSRENSTIHFFKI